jgi:hypothetical protein
LLNSFLPRFLVDAFVFFQVFVPTFTAKRAACRPPEVTLVSIHWACQFCQSGTANMIQSSKLKLGQLIHLPVWASKVPADTRAMTV